MTWFDSHRFESGVSDRLGVRSRRVGRNEPRQRDDQGQLAGLPHVGFYHGINRIVPTVRKSRTTPRWLPCISLETTSPPLRHIEDDACR